MKQSEKLIRDSPESVQTAVTLGSGDSVLADALAGLQVALGVLARLAAAALHAALGVPEPPVVRLHKPSVTISTVLSAMFSWSPCSGRSAPPPRRASTGTGP